MAQCKGPAERRALVVAGRASYRTAAYLRAAAALNIELVVAVPRVASTVLRADYGVQFDLENPDVTKLVDDVSQSGPVGAVVATDDSVVTVAAEIAERLGLPYNPVSAVRFTQRKDLARTLQRRKGVKAPQASVVDLTRPMTAQLKGVQFPCVVKPVALSASRGVIRANTPDELTAALERVRRLLEKEVSGPLRHRLLVEDFIEGQEIAVEGFVRAGQFELLMVFDKPDPLDGPFFEETYYVSPSRIVDDARAVRAVQQVVDAYAMVSGPVHAEFRVNADGLWLLELAARTIGGDCAQIVPFATGQSLESMVLDQALGASLTRVQADRAVGVLMLPVPRPGGVLRRVEGLSRARKVDGVVEVLIDAQEGTELIPWPEGSAYPGFVFARGDSAAFVERALREAHAALTFVTAPKLPLRLTAGDGQKQIAPVLAR